MSRQFVSTLLAPYERGVEFGETHRDSVRSTVAGYLDLFASYAADRAWDVDELGREALRSIDGWAPELGEEVRGIAAGGGVCVSTLAAVNARTEVLAVLGRAAALKDQPRHLPHECSTVVSLDAETKEPVAAQNWDWFSEMQDNWLEWSIPLPDGRKTVTVTEYGIVGKIGINSAAVGVLVNILHHPTDGAGAIGVPVHVIARHILDTALDVNTALRALGTATVTASTALTVVGGTACGKTAVTAELWSEGPSFVLPTPSGLLIHTNHFLDARPAGGDTEPRAWPDTLIRYEVLQRTLHPRESGLRDSDIEAALSGHIGNLCCHSEPQAPPFTSYQTLATVRLSFEDCQLKITPGPPCELGEPLSRNERAGDARAGT